MRHLKIQDLHYNMEKKIKNKFNVIGKFMLITQKYKNPEKPLYDYAIFMEV